MNFKPTLLKTYNKQLISTDSIVIYLIAKQIKTLHIKLLENKNKFKDI